MEKFSDVVNWLKSNAVEGGSSTKFPSNDVQTKPAFGIEKSNHKMLDKPRFPAATTANFGTSWKFGLLFNNNAPFTFGGSQVSVLGNASAVTSHDTSNVNGEDDVEQPSSPSVKKSHEEGIIVVHEIKCKLYVKSRVGKVLLNALIYPGIKTNVQKNSVVAIFHTLDDGVKNENIVARTFLMRIKSVGDRDKLAAAIHEYAPAS
ncbi:hypothetical protein OROGR_026772 [Orobanche gracilis]